MAEKIDGIIQKLLAARESALPPDAERTIIHEL